MGDKVLITFLTILILYPTQCCATNVQRRSIDEDLKLADYVACVSIDKSVKYTENGKVCNVKHMATVVDAIKGVTDGDILEWNALRANRNLEIGSLYLVFLAKADRFCDRKETADCIAESPGRRDEVCLPDVESNRVLHWSLAIYPIGYYRGESDQSVLVRWFITLPKHIQAKPVDAKSTSTDSWVKLEELVSYLKRLQPCPRSGGRCEQMSLLFRLSGRTERSVWRYCNIGLGSFRNLLNLHGWLLENRVILVALNTETS